MARTTTARRRPACRSLVALGALGLALGGCTSQPSELEEPMNRIGAALSSRGLSRSAFYAVHPDGRPSDFVSFFFSPIGTSEWLPESSKPSLVLSRNLRRVGAAVPSDAIALVAGEPDREARRQIVVTADDVRGVVIAQAYELPSASPVLVREWPLAKVALAPGIAEMARSNIELGLAVDSTE
jgi:hypothetical protein